MESSVSHRLGTMTSFGGNVVAIGGWTRDPDGGAVYHGTTEVYTLDRWETGIIPSIPEWEIPPQYYNEKELLYIVRVLIK